MSSEVETFREVSLVLCHGIESLASPRNIRGCVAASTSLGMTFI